MKLVLSSEDLESCGIGGEERLVQISIITTTTTNSSSSAFTLPFIPKRLHYTLKQDTHSLLPAEQHGAATS